MLVGTLAPNSVGMTGRFTELLCRHHDTHRYSEKQAAAPTEHFGGCGYLHGGCVCHPLLHDGGWGLRQDAGSSLGLYSQVTLAGGWHSTGSWFNRADTYMARDSDVRLSHGHIRTWGALKTQRTWLNSRSVETLVRVLEDVICGLGRCAILFLSPEKPGLELCELCTALVAAESWAACCCAICIRW